MTGSIKGSRNIMCSLRTIVSILLRLSGQDLMWELCINTCFLPVELQGWVLVPNTTTLLQNLLFIKSGFCPIKNFLNMISRSNVSYKYCQLPLWERHLAETPYFCWNFCSSIGLLPWHSPLRYCLQPNYDALMDYFNSDCPCCKWLL